MPFSPLEETLSDVGGITPTARRFSINLNEITTQRRDEKTALDAIWKSVLDPAIEYCQVSSSSSPLAQFHTLIVNILAQNFVKGALAGPPPVIALLSMIRLNEAVLSEVQTRGGCAPLETYLIGQRLGMWPVFQNQMNAHVDGLKKLADSAAGGLLSRGAVKDATVQGVAQRFCAMFLSFVCLAADEADEAMVFSQYVCNVGVSCAALMERRMLRLRQELIRLVTTQSTKIKDPAQAASYQSTVYETVLQYLTVRASVVRGIRGLTRKHRARQFRRRIRARKPRSRSGVNAKRRRDDALR